MQNKVKGSSVTKKKKRLKGHQVSCDPQTKPNSFLESRLAESYFGFCSYSRITACKTYK